MRILALSILVPTIAFPGLAGCLGRPAPVAAAGEEVRARVLWLDPGRESAWFIPGELIDRYPLSALPLPAEKASALRTRIEDWPPKSDRPFNASGTVAECTGSGAKTPPAPAPDATDLEGLIAKSPVALLGTVEAAETGWDSWRDEVATRLTVRIESVLAPVDLPAGQASLVRIGGEMKVRGHRVCTDVNPSFYQPQPGDRILALGAFGPAGREAIDLHRVFAVRDGIVEPQPYPALRDRRPRILEEILRSFPAHP